MDIHEMRAELRTALDRMEAIDDAASTENRDLNEAESAEYRELESRVSSLNARIEREERRREMRDRADINAEPVQPRGSHTITGVRDYDASDFRSIGEFLHSVRFRPTDQRLRSVEHREQQPSVDTQVMGDGWNDSMDGPLGGYAVPEQFRTDLLEVAQQESIIRPRAFVIPAGTPPDAPISMPALDQGSDRNMFGGVEVDWIAEAGAKPQTDVNLRQVTLQPHEVAGHIRTSDKLLRNWAAADAVFRRLLTGAVAAATDYAFLRGTGGTQPQGIIGSSAAYEVARDTSSQIKYADIAAMYARMRMGGSPVWIASQAILPQLLNMTDGNGRLIFQPGARDGVQPQLLGFPIIWNERSPGLGNPGDLVFADLSYYIIKDGSGPFVAASEHVHFTTNETIIKVFFNVDGKPWLTGPIVQENGFEVSPFVVLDDPSGGDGDGDGGGDGDGDG